MKKTRRDLHLDGSLLPPWRRTARMPCILCFRAVALPDRSPGFGESVQGSKIIVSLVAGRCKGPAGAADSARCMAGFIGPGGGRDRPLTRLGNNLVFAVAADGDSSLEARRAHV